MTASRSRPATTRQPADTSAWRSRRRMSRRRSPTRRCWSGPTARSPSVSSERAEQEAARAAAAAAAAAAGTRADGGAGADAGATASGAGGTAQAAARSRDRSGPAALHPTADPRRAVAPLPLRPPRRTPASTAPSAWTRNVTAATSTASTRRSSSTSPPPRGGPGDHRRDQRLKKDGFPDDKARIVSENARTLKFDQYGFEDH